MADTAPVATERLHEYWAHGEGAAKIAWGSPGDFDRCVAELGKYIDDPQGYCNVMHKHVLGIYPAQHAAELKGRSAMATDASSSKPYGDVKYADPKNGKYPIDTEEHAKAAWSYINQAKNASAYPLNGVTLSEVKAAIMAACKKFGIDVADDSSDSSSRAEPVPFVRSYPLEDISIRAGGDGRTVDAYAAVFDTPAPIRDQDGDYIEVIDRRAFDRILTKIAPTGGRTGWRCGVFYNHGMTLHATPSDRNSVPIGVPLEIKADEHGLFTRTRYHKGELADQILEAIREGSHHRVLVLRPVRPVGACPAARRFPAAPQDRGTADRPPDREHVAGVRADAVPRLPGRRDHGCPQ